jgi:hypothetical protein
MPGVIYSASVIGRPVQSLCPRVPDPESPPCLMGLHTSVVQLLLGRGPTQCLAQVIGLRRLGGRPRWV